MIEFDYKGYIKTDERGEILIGREDIFDTFNIEFQQKDKKTTFRRIK